MSINASFVESIKKWIQIQQILESNNKKMKVLKQNKDVIEKNILNYMENQNMQDTQLKISNSNLIYNKTYTLAPLSISLIEETLNQYLSNSKDVNNILELLKMKREKNKKTNIHFKKKKIKVSRSKSKFKK